MAAAAAKPLVTAPRALGSAHQSPTAYTSPDCKYCLDSAPLAMDVGNAAPHRCARAYVISNGNISSIDSLPVVLADSAARNTSRRASLMRDVASASQSSCAAVPTRVSIAARESTDAAYASVECATQHCVSRTRPGLLDSFAIQASVSHPSTSAPTNGTRASRFSVTMSASTGLDFTPCIAHAMSGTLSDSIAGRSPYARITRSEAKFLSANTTTR
mmetsp:Transcript_4471/g.16365  ORF Transcript_4471/g.16365 Transcript_4471/m.16365 type:complete len:216 (+) Transcript_4471:138-785(+)